MISTEDEHTPERYIHIKYEKFYILYTNKLEDIKMLQKRG